MQSTITKWRKHFDNSDNINFFFSEKKLKIPNWDMVNSHTSVRAKAALYIFLGGHCGGRVRLRGGG